MTKIEKPGTESSPTEPRLPLRDNHLRGLLALVLFQAGATALIALAAAWLSREHALSALGGGAAVLLPTALAVFRLARLRLGGCSGQELWHRILGIEFGRMLSTVLISGLAFWVWNPQAEAFLLAFAMAQLMYGAAFFAVPSEGPKQTSAAGGDAGREETTS